MLPRRLSLALLIVAALAPVPAAHATLYPGDALDGPSADIDSVGDVDVARDARGAVVYLKDDGGVAHVFAARFREGGFAAPERLDPGFVTPSAQPVVATSNDGRIAVAFVHDGALWGVVRASGDAAWSTPTLLYADPAPLSNPVTNPSIDMSINGVAYVVFSSAGNVYATRLVDTTWTPIASALDIDPAQSAGLGAGRPRVAVSADNNAVATWGEGGPDGRQHVYARRLTELTPSASPQDLTLPDLDGHAGRDADSPDIDIEDDSSFAWAVFRQGFDDGGVTRSRTVARRLVGSLFDPPVTVDGLTFPASAGAEDPRIDMTGRGEALVASGRTGPYEVWGDVLSFDKFAPAARVDTSAGASPPRPVAATGENRYGVIAWQHDAGAGSREIVARLFLDDPNDHFEAEQVVSRPEWGPADASRGFEAAADRAGNSVIAFIQGTGADSRLVVAELDRAPGRAQGLSTTKFQRFSRPTLRWRASTDTLGTDHLHGARRRGGGRYHHGHLARPRRPDRGRAAQVGDHRHRPPRPAGRQPHAPAAGRRDGADHRALDLGQAQEGEGRALRPGGLRRPLAGGRLGHPERPDQLRRPLRALIAPQRGAPLQAPRDLHGSGERARSGGQRRGPGEAPEDQEIGVFTRFREVLSAVQVILGIGHPS